MKKSKLIVFSGGCFSGKTTTMEELKTSLEAKGHTVCLLSELIRKVGITSIDDARNNPHEYLHLQAQVTPTKIAEEYNALTSNYDYTLIDRSILDSLFYLQFYTTKQAFDLEEWSNYSALTKQIEAHIEWAKKNYHAVLFFKPIEAICFDRTYRPSHIDLTKYIESSAIYHLLIGYGFKPTVIDLNKTKITSYVIK